MSAFPSPRLAFAEHPPLSGGVLKIVFLCTYEQMIRPYAFSVIAMMAGLHSFWKFIKTIANHDGHTMRSISSAFCAYPYRSIPDAIQPTSPFPAVITVLRDHNALPEVSF
jgi:hypothetical protein